jgi:hypothetical protein
MLIFTGMPREGLQRKSFLPFSGKKIVAESPTPSYDDIRNAARGHAQIKMNLNANSANFDKIKE